MATLEETAFDFRSDTVTLPTQAMRAAMAEAEMGDDVYGEDPSVNALQDHIASLTGMEAALFFPTGSMANLAALMCHTQPGSMMFTGFLSHIKRYELGGYARIAGLSLTDIDDQQGFLNLEQLQERWSPDIYYMTQAGIVCVENTHNIGGGLVYPVQELIDLRRFTREKKVPIHMDGARLWHAAVAQDRPLTDWTRHVDSVMMSVSKGLGAPVGSVLAASQATVDQARIQRKLLGGGMRQAGMLAAGARYAVDNHLPLLERDHTRCREVYGAIKNLFWLKAVEPQTNILIFKTEKPEAVAMTQWLAEQGLRCLPLAADRVRLVFHLNLSDEACERAIDKIKEWGRDR
ncbi:threonine aldolase family protein [Acanthopleuribacter pedis]|uniref:Threonine aldolase family protein n=1 Tax=Acanthopleuribacter pedis TaxID=442870 RepID=A0A8J7U4L8_9BACT|nr:threonine aldolase family protein [Acanthopleuribacter pedis]MBO1321618.1 threonine aldolase family protein [Acanthopleuribacter pedis]